MSWPTTRRPPPPCEAAGQDCTIVNLWLPASLARPLRSVISIGGVIDAVRRAVPGVNFSRPEQVPRALPDDPSPATTCVPVNGCEYLPRLRAALDHLHPNASQNGHGDVRLAIPEYASISGVADLGRLITSRLDQSGPK